MSDDSNSTEAKTEDHTDQNDEENTSKSKKIKLSNDDSEVADANENENTKSEISEALKDAPENIDLTINSGDSSTNNSDLIANKTDISTNNSLKDAQENTDSVVNTGDSSTNTFDLVISSADTSTHNSDSTSNGCEAVESASSNDCNSTISKSECADSNNDVPEQSSKNDTAEAEQSNSLTQNDDQENKSNSAVIKEESESSKASKDLVTDNEKPAAIEAETNVKNDKSKVKEESLYELLNNPKDVQDEANIDTNEKAEDSAASNGNTEKVGVALQDESLPTEIQKSDEIDCKELFDILQEKDKKLKKRVLIIDVRSEEEYCKSRMKFHDNLINIPAEKIQLNKVPGYYRYILLCDIEAERKFSRRSHNDIIVLLDKNSELKTLDSDSKIAIFKNSLEEYDVHIDYKRIAILKGGFEEWTNLYPDFVTKS